jgi:hypothetical protein
VVYLKWQKRSSGVNNVDAREAILQSNLLSTEVLLDGDGKAGTSLERSIVSNDQT